MSERLEELALELVQRLRHGSPKDFRCPMFEQLKNLSDSRSRMVRSGSVHSTTRTQSPGINRLSGLLWKHVRFAFKTSPQNTTWPDMLAVWRAADDIDVFESGWTFDHFYPIFSDPTGPCLEGWTTTTALAQATTRLRVGLMVTGNVYRHPAVLANMAATVDVISGGRLELGLGAGWNQQECDAYGIDLPPLKERFDRFDEACQVIIGLLTNETTD